MSTRRPAQRPPTRRTTRPRGPAARNQLLDVKVRRSTARRTRNRRVTAVIMRILLIVSLGTASYFGLTAVVEKFFLTNPEYNLRHVETDLDGLLTTDEVLALTDIKLGTNIFQIDLGSAERALRQIDQIASVRIERNWPDQLRIQATKRHPAAWLARVSTNAFSADNALLVDSEGATIRPYRIEPHFWQLPVVYCPDPALITSGDILAKADLAAALELIELNAKRPDSLLEIRSLDVSRGYAITVVNDAKANITFSPTNLPDQLDRLQRLLAHCAETGRQLDNVNLIPSKYSPVEFIMASATQPTAPARPDSAQSENPEVQP